MTTLAAHAAAHGSADPLTVILIGFAVAACYLLSLYLKPIRSCPRCGGTGARLTRAGRPTGGTCRRCRGTGRIRRIGAVAMHRFYRSAVGDQLRERRRARPIPSAHRPPPRPATTRPEEPAMIALLITIAVIYLAYHAGHAHANYRHGRARGHRGINLYWSSARGPWISIPGPFGTRIGHRL
jgi:hypothetical protein